MSAHVCVQLCAYYRAGEGDEEEDERGPDAGARPDQEEQDCENPTHSPHGAGQSKHSSQDTYRASTREDHTSYGRQLACPHKDSEQVEAVGVKHNPSVVNNKRVWG